MPELQVWARRSETAAFTLVELLVVVSVIGLLSAMLANGLTHAKEQARRAACRSNQRQIAVALQLYGADNRDLLPSGQVTAPQPGGHTPIYLPLIATNTQRALLRYLSNSNLLDCPNVHRPLVASTPLAASWRYPLDGRSQQVGYLYLAGRPETPWPLTGPPVTAAWTSPQRLSDDPSLPAIADLSYVAPCVYRVVVAHGHRGPLVQQMAFNQFPPLQVAADRVRASAIDGSNVARLDGSVEWRSRTRLSWHRAANDMEGLDNNTCVAIW